MSITLEHRDGGHTRRLVDCLVAGLIGSSMGCERLTDITRPPTIAPPSSAPQILRAALNTGPDIVLYLVDDQSWHSFKRSMMPQLFSRLVDRGTLFNLGFVVTADCCPSRIGLFTGVFQHSVYHRIYGDAAPAGGATAWHGDDDALAVWVRAAGYYTAYAGAKYLNEYNRMQPWPYVPPGWDSWRVKRNPTYLGDSLVTRVGAGPTTIDAEPAGAYSTDRMVTWAAAAMREAPPTQPLFLQLATNAPHFKYTPPPRYANLYQTVADCGPTAPHTPTSYEEADVSDQPQYVRALFGKTNSRKHADTAWQQTCGAVRAIDDMVAATLDSLAAIRSNRPTLVCYTSDNGYMWGEHWLREAKWSPFEEASRIPFLCTGFNGVSAAVRSDSTSLVQMIDLTTTILDYASASATHALSGRSLRAVLQGGVTPANWRKSILLEQFRPNRTARNYSCVRTLKLKFCVYETAETTFYDLAKYPRETWNAVHVPSYATTIASLGRKLDSLKRLP
jgi:N-acetylglucosamine-6-sulfatase